MMSKIRLPFLRPFRRKNRTWKYRQFAPDEEEEGEAKAKPYRSDLWVLLRLHIPVIFSLQNLFYLKLFLINLLLCFLNKEKA